MQLRSFVLITAVVALTLRSALPADAAAPTAATASSAATAAVPFDDAHALTYKVIAAPLTEPSAPADEYFGRLKLSNLGIRNIIHAITVEGNSPLALPGQVTRIQAVRDSMADWADKYPRDSWLPGTIVKFATLLESKQQPSYDETAISLFWLLVEHYPKTWYSKFAARQLANYEEVPPMDMLTSPDVNDFANVAAYTFPLPH